MLSVSNNEALQTEFETEFEGLVMYIVSINLKTEEAFQGANTLDVKDIIRALIDISSINSDIDKNLRIVCLKVIRKVVELENKGAEGSPAAEWESEDWANFRDEIRKQQDMLRGLGVIRLVCDLIAYEQKLAIKEEAILVAIAMLLGGNEASQLAFNTCIKEDTQNAFMLSLREMIFEAFEFITVTQTKRNGHKEKMLQI